MSFFDIMIAEYSTIRSIILENKKKPLEQMVGNGPNKVPVSFFARILDLSLGKTCYLIKHPDNITAEQCLKLAAALNVHDDTFYDLSVNQFKMYKKRFAFTVDPKYWTIRKRRIKRR